MNSEMEVRIGDWQQSENRVDTGTVCIEEDAVFPQDDTVLRCLPEAAVRPSTVAGGVRRSNPFQWLKPPEMDRRTLTASARMEAEVTHKDKVIRALARQLRKANEEKYRLVIELSGYRGSNRERLYSENRVLRERLDRVTRENLMLRGLDMREKNSRLQ